MSATNLSDLRKVLAFAAIVEAATGLALIIAPGTVVALLMGSEVSDAGTQLGRCFGIALLALGSACRPSRQRLDSDLSSFRAMLGYNALIALYLAYLGAAGRWSGLLLWPGVMLHLAVAFLLARSWYIECWIAR